MIVSRLTIGNLLTAERLLQSMGEFRRFTVLSSGIIKAMDLEKGLFKLP
jgi:hypothetical protein